MKAWFIPAIKPPGKEKIRGINWPAIGLLFRVVPQAQGQADSFEELALPLFDSLYNFAHWLTQNREEAEDLVQETFTKALKGFSSFQAGTNFRAWMFRILRNTFLTSRTGLQARMTVPLDVEENEAALPITPETPESILLDRASDKMMQQALQELPVIFREALLLCDVEEMSYQEIAETLSIPIGTVMSRLSRARRMARASLQKMLRVGTRADQTSRASVNDIARG